MQQTITEKIFSEHSGTEARAGQIVECPIDMVIGNDITTPLSIRAFEEAPIRRALAAILRASISSNIFLTKKTWESSMRFCPRRALS